MSGNGTSQRPYCWVVTFDIAPDVDEETSSEPKVTFWEALGGKQYELPHPSDDKNSSNLKGSNQKHSFSELHCLFRHNCFMLNIQHVCTVPNTGHVRRPDVVPPPVMSFSLANNKNFALFPSHAISPMLQHPGCGLHLSYEDRFSRASQVSALEVSIEKSLRDEIANRRYEKSLYTNFDEGLSIILQVLLCSIIFFLVWCLIVMDLILVTILNLMQPVLASYELDRVVGSTFGNSDFQSSIRRNVQEGECFKAFPTCFSHCNSAVMFAKLRRSEAAMDVIMTAGRGCRHGLRVKIEVYPEGMVAVWLMLAVCAEKAPGASGGK